jgi:glycosyltransferase involved in cell wall biosynthesis
MSLPTLSVAMPHYNHGRFVRRAVEAIFAQSFRPLEVILVDDGSTDGSQSVLRDLAASYPNLRLHANDRNRGVGFTSNRALSLCRGDYVYMTAADDLVQPGFFAAAMSLARSHTGAGLVYGKMAMTDEDDRVLKVFEVSAWPTARFAAPEPFRREHLEREAPDHSLCAATIYRRDALQDLGGYRTELGHWMDTFVARCIGLRHGVCYVPQTFMHWRFSPHGFSASSRWDDLVRIVRRAAVLMRSPPYCQWFPESHVAWWEGASLTNLFHARVLSRWPLLRRWHHCGGWRARLAQWSVRALAGLTGKETKPV